MSIGPATSRTDAYALWPSTSVSCGLIGMTVKPWLANARTALLPNLRRLDEAPMTATVFMDRFSHESSQEIRMKTFVEVARGVAFMRCAMVNVAVLGDRAGWV